MKSEIVSSCLSLTSEEFVTLSKRAKMNSTICKEISLYFIFITLKCLIKIYTMTGVFGNLNVHFANGELLEFN
jgi:hypothetical protein